MSGSPGDDLDRSYLEKLLRVITSPGYSAIPYRIVGLLENPKTGEVREVAPEDMTSHYGGWQRLGFGTYIPKRDATP